MEQEFKKQITLSEAVVTMLTGIKAEIDKLQAQINEKQTTVSNLLTGICLNDGVDIQKDGIKISDDLRSLLVYDLPSNKEPEKETTKPVKTKLRKGQF